MNFIKFPVASTNIFPIANTTEGGQLVTEFNLRSRESVYTSENVEYFIGASFVHSERDFYVERATASTNYFDNTTTTSSSILQISNGRGVINGHYVECLTPIEIDMVEAAKASNRAGDTELIGELSVGLRAMYSTEVTLSGSILTENNNDLYEGIQVVILPKSEFILPEDSPTDQSQVKAHILLATFNYYNGVISNVVNNYPKKCKMIDALRVGNIDNLLSSVYVKKDGLNPKMFYTLAGKFDPSTGYASMEWCDSTSSLMVWDIDVPTPVDTPPEIRVAKFVEGKNRRGVDTVNLIVPHKQIDGMAASNQYFAPAVLDIPVADYETGTAGVVNKEYTDNIKNLYTILEGLYTLPEGHLKEFIDELRSRDNLPSLEDTNWSVGDYVLVSQDYTINYTLADSSRKPSTMYCVLDGFVQSIAYSDQSILVGNVLATIRRTSRPSDDPVVFNQYWDLSKYRGVPQHDYFLYIYEHDGTTTEYKYVVWTVSGLGYSEPILVTGGVPLAEEAVVGGFLNVPDTAIDQGYVKLDSKGYLRLVDYDLLRSGTLAYQLAADYTVPKGITLDQIQAYLDEYVNQRIAFPNQYQLETSEPNRINIYIEISDETEGTLNLYEIDSRFNTSVCIHITVSEGKYVNTTINVSDCEKVQIDSAITTIAQTQNIKVNIYRSNLYYDADIFDFCTKMQDINIWYERFSSSDPVLSVDGRTVTQIMSTGIYSEANVNSVSDWSNINVNDYEFAIALQSITFNASGNIVGCGVLVRNNSTSNVQFGKNVITNSFVLPQGPNLMYPKLKLQRPVKVTGEFISAYTSSSESDGITVNNMVVQDTHFSIITQRYDDNGAMIEGNIAFLVDSYSVPVGSSLNPPEWNTTSFHYFEGSSAF